jgi:hypothetical protein
MLVTKMLDAHQAVNFSCFVRYALSDNARQVALCIGPDGKQHEDGKGLKTHGVPGSSEESGLQ